MSKLTQNITGLQSVLDRVNALPEAGTELPELTNPATEFELFADKELIDADGNVVKGTFSIDEELTTQDDLIAQISAALEGKASGGGNDDIPTNVTLNFSWTATSSDLRPEVFYSFIDEYGHYVGNTYIASSTTSESTTLTVAKNSIICIVCKSSTSSLWGVAGYSVSDEIIGLNNYSSTLHRYRNALFLINNNGSLTVIMDVQSNGGSND